MSHMERLNDLAAQARPTDDDDWGSERQIAAENLFFAEVEKVLDAVSFDALEAYCLKATPDEMIDKALEMIAE